MISHPATRASASERRPQSANISVSRLKVDSRSDTLIEVGRSERLLCATVSQATQKPIESQVQTVAVTPRHAPQWFR